MRSAIGLGQGFVSWLLYSAAHAHAWPATEPGLFTPLLLVALLVPVVALPGLGNVRPVTLASWLACALALLVVVGVHEVARDQPGMSEPDALAVFGALPLALFIAHSLVAAGDADRRPIAAYPTYFDVAWKHEVQLLLSLLFLGLFWGVLWLGTELFGLIGLDAPCDHAVLVRDPGERARLRLCPARYRCPGQAGAGLRAAHSRENPLQGGKGLGGG